MSATATIEQQHVSRPTTAVYRAARTDLRLVKKRRRPIRDPATSEVIGTTEGQVVAFVGGVVEIPLEGTVVLRDTSDAGECELPVDEVLAWLDRHKLIGNPHEGFVKVEVAAPAPSQEELSRLMEAAWDEDMLAGIIEQERAGWGREAIINVAQGALERVRKLRAEVEQDTRDRLEAERAEQQPAKAKPAKPAAQA